MEAAVGIVMAEAEAVIVVAEEATGAEEGGGISFGVGWCHYSFTQNAWPVLSGV